MKLLPVVTVSNTSLKHDLPQLTPGRCGEEETDTDDTILG